MTLLEIVIEVREEQERNAHSPIIVTLLGMVMEVKEEHSENAYFPIVVIPSEMVTFLRDFLDEYHGAAQFPKFIISPSPVKVISPVSLSSIQFIVPIVPDVNEKQEENAFSPIVVIPSEIITFLI